MNSKRVFACATALASLSIVAAFALHLQFRFVDYSEPIYAEDTQTINNPYVGWYEIQFFRLSDSEALDLSRFDSQDYGPSLVLLEVSLQNYRERPLSNGAIQQLHALLSTCRANGQQAILRFMYDHEGQGVEHEPSDISLVLTHMTQSAAIINQYADCVYILQGLFVGSWGELHTSNFVDPTSLRKLAEHLSSVLDPSIYMAVRTPEQWRTITETASPDVAQGSLGARLSLFNDGMLGSGTDLGTYAEPGTTSSATEPGKWERTRETAFQNVLCDYVPNGGEVVVDNSHNDLQPAVAALRETHVSYLNSDYDAAVLDKWKETVYAGPDAFQGMSGYDYIERHLGYRYTVRASELIFPGPWMDTAVVAVHVENTGFSPAYRTFEAMVRLSNVETGEEYDIPVEADNRQWLPGTETVVEIPVKVRTILPETYEVSLWMRDPVTGFNVFFANSSSEDTGGVPMGSLRIRQFPNL